MSEDVSLSPDGDRGSDSGETTSSGSSFSSGVFCLWEDDLLLCDFLLLERFDNDVFWFRVLVAERRRLLSRPGDLLSDARLDLLCALLERQ